MTVVRDRDLRKRIQNFLVQKNVIRQGAVFVEVANGHVSLTGHVGSYYEKQLVLHATQHVAGVVTIDDGIDVLGALETEPAGAA